MSQSLLEMQHERLSTRADYGTAAEGVRIFDLDNGEYVEPANLGLEADLGDIAEFMTDNGADPEQVKYTTIGLFRSNSPHIQMLDRSLPGAKTKLQGYVNPNVFLTGSGGLRFPVVALRHDTQSKITTLNHNLRHELFHLLRPVTTLAYENMQGRNKFLGTSMLVNSLVIPPAIDMLQDGYSMVGSGSLPETSSAITTTGVVLAALASTAFTALMRAHPYDMLNLVEIEEWRAELFAYRNYKFRPFSRAVR